MSGVFLSSYKSAIVTPLLNKPSLDPNDLKYYRPVSTLSFMSKILEKVVVSQLMSYLNRHNLFNLFGHSTEIALLKVVNDLLLAMAEGKLSDLVFLDLSAVFDTIDHDILLHPAYSMCLVFKALCYLSSDLISLKDIKLFQLKELILTKLSCVVVYLRVLF